MAAAPPAEPRTRAQQLFAGAQAASAALALQQGTVIDSNQPFVIGK